MEYLAGVLKFFLNLTLYMKRLIPGCMTDDKAWIITSLS